MQIKLPFSEYVCRFNVINRMHVLNAKPLIPSSVWCVFDGPVILLSQIFQIFDLVNVNKIDHTMFVEIG